MKIYHIPRYITSNNDTDLHTTSKTESISKPYFPTLVAKRIATLVSLIIQVNSSKITSIYTNSLLSPHSEPTIKRPSNPLISFRFKQFCFTATILCQCIKSTENRLYLARTSRYPHRPPRS